MALSGTPMCPWGGSSIGAVLAERAFRTGRFLARERLIRDYLQWVSQEIEPDGHLFTGVNVIARFDRDDAVRHNVDVRIERGQIVSIEESDTAPRLERWLVGGLVDSHVHTQFTERQTIAHLIHGITGVREMCGFPWMTSRRDRIAASEELGPRMMVAGHIISTHEMDGYTTVVGDPEETRAVLEAQRSAGYQAVKVHNRLSPDIYDAAAEWAKESGLPLVGHIPHHIPIEHAIESGQRTLEHLKGYYQDWDLELSAEPWQELTERAEVWNCPTLALVDKNTRGYQAEALFRNARGLVDPEVLKEWRIQADEDEDRVVSRIYERSQGIVAELVPVSDRWLAGTDSGGGEPLLVPGLALHREIELMEQAGIDRQSVLHAATHAITDAHPEAGFPAGVAVDEPADLLLLESDPRTVREAYADPISVVAGGRILDRETRNSMRSELESLDALELNEGEVVEILSGEWSMDENDWHRALAADVLRAAGADTAMVGGIPAPRTPIPTSGVL